MEIPVEKAMAATKVDGTSESLGQNAFVDEMNVNESEPYENGPYPPQSIQKDLFTPQGSIETVLGHSAETLKSADNLHEKSWTADEVQLPNNDTKQNASVAFRNLNLYGFGTTTDYQKTFANYPLAWLSRLGILFGHARKSRIDILRDFEGLVSCGELLLVLGRPGSGCTTFLKTLAGHTHGLHVEQSSEINYQGRTAGDPIPPCSMV